MMSYLVSHLDKFKLLAIIHLTAKMKKGLMSDFLSKVTEYNKLK